METISGYEFIFKFTPLLLISYNFYLFFRYLVENKKLELSNRESVRLSNRLLGITRAEVVVIFIFFFYLLFTEKSSIPVSEKSSIPDCVLTGLELYLFYFVPVRSILIIRKERGKKQDNS